MVLHSRGCGRVARRRFKRIGPPGRALGSREALFLCSLFGLPGGRRSGNPIFYIPPVFFTFRPNPMRVPGRPFLFIPLFFFPLVSLTWIPACGGGVIRVPDAGEWCRSGAIRAFYGRPIPPKTVDSMVQDVADRRSVSSEYRTGVIRVPM